MRSTRRTFLASAAAGLSAAGCATQVAGRTPASGASLLGFPPEETLLDPAVMALPEMRIAGFEASQWAEECWLLRVWTDNGAEGIFPCSQAKWAHVGPFFESVVAPALIGEDAREIEEIEQDFAREYYELQGTPLWIAFGHAEHAILDLLGKALGLPVARLFAGGVQRTEIPFYISSNQRGGAPEAEAETIAMKVAETGCAGAKFKVGRRMGRNRDAAPGWTPAITRAVRAALGDAAVLYADANGCFDPANAIEVSRMLADHGVAMFEEPCPGEERMMMVQATAGSAVPVGGGENEFSLPGFRDMIAARTFQIVQADPVYVGGMLRCVRVHKLAHDAGLLSNPHYPRNDAEIAPLMHLCAVIPSLWGLQEYRLRPHLHPYPHSHNYRLSAGVVRLPEDPGFGVSYGPDAMRDARRLG